MKTTEELISYINNTLEIQGYAVVDISIHLDKNIVLHALEEWYNWVPGRYKTWHHNYSFRVDKK